MGIREARAAAEAQGYYREHLTDPEMDLAQRQYMFKIHNPNGRAWSLSYRSFSAGQQERDKVKTEIAKEYGVTEDHLGRAEFMYSARFLC